MEFYNAIGKSAKIKTNFIFISVFKNFFIIWFNQSIYSLKLKIRALADDILYGSIAVGFNKLMSVTFKLAMR